MSKLEEISCIETVQLIKTAFLTNYHENRPKTASGYLMSPAAPRELPIELDLSRVIHVK